MQEFKMEEMLYEEFDVFQISNKNNFYIINKVSKKVISEISLKIIVNGSELASLLCLNQYHEELAIGFLFSEGVINSYSDIKDIYYNEQSFAVVVQLINEIIISKSESLRSVTTGCGKCITYINPLKKSTFTSLNIDKTFLIDNIMNSMKNFISQSNIFKNVGGVHSVLFSSSEYELLNEDIGRHNCFDKIAGILLRKNQMELTKNAILYVSGRISSEIVTKVIRLKVPIIVSRSTPTTSAVKLAQQYNITLLGYVRNDNGYIYTCSDRIITT
jgi:FdhD protein